MVIAKPDYPKPQDFSGEPKDTGRLDVFRGNEVHIPAVCNHAF
jgi:hypothetical protein